MKVRNRILATFGQSIVDNAFHSGGITELANATKLGQSNELARSHSRRAYRFNDYGLLPFAQRLTLKTDANYRSLKFLAFE